MGLVINPLSLILHAICQGGLPTTMALVQTPESFVSVAVRAGVEPFPVPHGAKRVTL